MPAQLGHSRERRGFGRRKPPPLLSRIRRFGWRTFSFAGLDGPLRVGGEDRFQFAAGAFPLLNQALDDGRTMNAESLIDDSLERSAGGADREVEQFGNIRISFPATDARTICTGYGFHQSKK
jgi:hypothetical protein